MQHYWFPYNNILSHAAWGEASLIRVDVYLYPAYISLLRSLHPLGVSTGPGWKLSHFVLKKIYVKNQNDLAFHLGPVQPPSGEGSPLFHILTEYLTPVRRRHCHSAAWICGFSFFLKSKEALKPNFGFRGFSQKNCCNYISLRWVRQKNLLRSLVWVLVATRKPQ